MKTSRLLYFLTLISAVLLGLGLELAYTGHGGEEVDYISPKRVKELFDGGEKIALIDLRTAKEFQQRRLSGARSIPVAELEKRLQEVPKTGRVILYCACRPGEEAYAFFLLRDQGYRNIVVLEDGFPGWVKQKFPIETRQR